MFLGNGPYINTPGPAKTTSIGNNLLLTKEKQIESYCLSIRHYYSIFLGICKELFFFMWKREPSKGGY